MFAALLQILPLAFGSIAPTMIGLVVLLLSAERGLLNALAFVLGKCVLYLLWGLLSLQLAGHISATNPGRHNPLLAAIFLIFGVLLLVLALRNVFGEDDPDAPPSKILTLLGKMGPLKLFGVGIGLSLLQPRFIFLILAGAALIADARLSATGNTACLLVLTLLAVWPMLIPILVYAVMGERRHAAMKAMRRWLTDNRRKVNVVVMGVFGVLLLVWGLTGIL